MIKGPLFISFIYFIIGMLWILYSDWVTYHVFSNAEIKTITIFQNIKGGVYIFLTTILLYFLIRFSQKKLSKNQENLDRILNSLNDVVWSIDVKQKKYVYLSQSVEKITGIPYLSFKNDVDKWHRIIHPDDKGIIGERQKRIFSQGYSETTYRLIKPDGEVVWIHDKVNLIKNEKGKPLLMEGIASDITSLKGAQDETIRYANRLNLILESITDGFFTINKEFCFTRVNLVFEKLTGIERHRILGKLIWTVFPPNLYPDLFSQISGAMKNHETSNYQGYFDRYNLWLDIKSYPYVEGLSIFLRDISEEKKVQQKLSFNKKNLDALINNTTDLIWSIDKNMCILSANKAFLDKFENHFGLTLNIGDKLSSDGFNDYDTNKWEEKYDRAFKGESFTIINEENRNGQSEYYEISFNPIYSEDNEVFGAGCFARDITERKQHEQERNHLIEKLIAQNNGLEEFSYVTSHKIRAPVANILGIVNLLNKDTINDDHNKILLDYLEVATHTLDQTIRDLTSIMEMQKVGREVMEVIDLGEIYAQAQQNLEPLIKETGAVLLCDFSQVSRLTTVKSTMLNILVQLLSNSMTYKKPGQVPRIFIKSFLSDGYVGISVSDNGLGIDLPKHKDQLFKLYKRFHWQSQGKGIGLYIVKAQVEALNGKLEVYSEVNKGTTFKVFLMPR
jgi:PAS domain S-box-containing protein